MHLLTNFFYGEHFVGICKKCNIIKLQIEWHNVFSFNNGGEADAVGDVYVSVRLSVHTTVQNVVDGFR